MGIFKSSKGKLIKPNIEKMEAKRDVSGLIQALRHDDVNIRINAALALGKIKRARAVAPLIETLRDADEDVRWAAAWALGEIGKPAARPLIQALRDEDGDVRWKAAWALEKIGKVVVDSLIEAMRTESGEAKAKVSLVLGSIGDVRAVRPLVKALKDEDDNVRWAAAWALEKLGPTAVKYLINNLALEDAEARKEAAIALGVIRDESAIDPLIAAMRDEDKQVRREAAAALVSISSRKAIAGLEAYLKGEDEDLRRLAVAVLAKLGWQPKREEDLVFLHLVNRDWDQLAGMGAQSFPHLLRALKKEGWETRSKVAALVREKSDVLLSPLMQALDSEDEELRREAALLLKEMGDAQTLDALLQAMRNRDWFVRRSATLALGEVGDPRALEALIEALKDEDEDVRRAAAWALGKMGDLATEPLMELLLGGGVEERRGAAWALGVIRDARAVEALIEALKDEDEDVRRGAAWALGELGEQALPSLDKALDVEEVATIAREIISRIQSGEEGEVEGVEVEAAHAEEVFLSPMELEEIGLESATPALEEKVVEEAAAQVVSEVLGKMGWKPEEEEKADYFIARRQWDKVTEMGELAVDSLVNALEDEDEEVRSRAAWALGVIGSPRAVDSLVSALEDPVRDVRVKAAGSLKKIGTHCTDALLQALQEGGDELRKEAARVLGDIKDLRAVPFLVKALGDPDEKVRGRAANALEKIGEPAVEALQAALSSDDPNIRALAASILTKMGLKPSELVSAEEGLSVERLEGARARELILEGKWEEVATLGENAVEALLEAVEDRDPEVRRGAAWALGVIRNPRVVDALVSLLGDEDGSVRSGAAWALGVIGDPRAVPSLVRSLEDGNAEVRRKAAWALGEIGDEGAVDALVRVLEDEDQDVRRVSLLVLEKLGWKPTEEEEVRRLIAEREWDRLAGMGDVAVESLIEALSAGDSETRMKAAWALGEIGDPRALEPLAAALADSEPRVREKAAIALGKLGESKAVEDLLRHLDDEDESVREAVSRSLRELGWEPEEEEVIAEAEKVVSAAEEGARIGEMEEVAIAAEEETVAAEAEIGERLPVEEEGLVEAAGAMEIPKSETEAPLAEPVTVAVPDEFAEEKAGEGAPAMEGAAEEVVLPSAERAEKEVIPALVPERGTEEKPPAGTGYARAEALIAQRRWKDLLALGEEAVLPLVEVLRSGDKGDRKKAAFVLREIGLAVVPSLRNLLHDRREEVRLIARDILAGLGWKTGDEEELAQELIREGKWEEVARMGKPAVLPLTRALRDAQAEKRRMAASVLGTLQDAAAFEPLLASLHDTDREVRGKAAWALGKLGDPRACEHLVKALADEDAEVRAKAAASLERLGWVPGDDREKAFYFLAVRQWNKLADMGEAAEGALQQRTEDADPEVRDMARCLLEDIRGSRELKELLGNP